MDPDAFVANESSVRLAGFIMVFLLMACWEILSPKRRLEIPKLLRWTNNLALVALDTALIRLLFPLLAVGMATSAEQNGWGLLQMTNVPFALACFLAVIILDLAIYAQHVLFHAVPVLWRLHRMHHADLDFDVSTGVRFHPLEIVLSMGIKLMVVVVLGAPALGVLLFELWLNATALFSHSNVRLPKGLDRTLRYFIVTPDMHRIHHSVLPAETNSNFGFNLTWWDRLFNSYRVDPMQGHEQMTIGLAKFRNSAELRLDRMLVQPFRQD